MHRSACSDAVSNLQLTIINRSSTRRPLDRRRLRRVLDLALAESAWSASVCTLTVMLVDDAESRRLHDDHFRDPTPTDVMTFPDGTVDPADGHVHLGDLAVGVEVARREAELRGRPHGDELTLYALHGLLHLLGYDDVTAAKRRRMWAAQHRLLAAVGIAIEEQPC